MRTSILSRSVIAVASLAIGAAALAATPATAATSTGVTRDLVLTAAHGLRAETDGATEDQVLTFVRAAHKIAARTCYVDSEAGEFLMLTDLSPATTSDNADGLLIRAQIVNLDTQIARDCSIGAFATTDPAFQLSGTASISSVDDEPVVQLLGSDVLSGDVFVTAPIDARNYDDLVVSASGNATKSTDVTTSTKVADKKTTKQKKAAKKVYSKALKSAKKSYTKALDKAGKSKSKKTAAKKAYAKKKSSAKAKYKAATANFKIVTTTAKVLAESRPFSITTAQDNTGS